jgi:VacB/RNase II family 3'-5' exoribonuclease
MKKEFDLEECARRALIAAGFQPNFPPEVQQELQNISSVASGNFKVPDLRALLWSSIDNEDSRDLDQVEYAERAENGCIRLLIGIADVATFVRQSGPIDLRAHQNTVSIYTAGKTFHLLPEELSTDKTSLLENVDHLALVIEMRVQADGEIENPQVYHALVRNQARLSYETVGRFFDEHGAVDFPGDFPALRDQLHLQGEVTQRLIGLRKRTGALTFSSYEAKPIRKNGEVVDLVLIRHDRARDLIETFMVAANVATATFLKSHGWPIIERVVRAPKRWDRIRQIAAGYGTNLPEDPAPKPLADFLVARRFADPASFNELSLTIVKLLGAGEYVVEHPTGPQTTHFGLAVDDYSHSTAPNRRFADLVLQRLLLALIYEKPNPYSDPQLQEIAGHCTEREHAARKLERSMRKIVAAYIVRNRIGEVFDAIVTGASWKGTWVRVKQPAIEGKVIRGEIGLDVGDRVRVKLMAVDPERGFIDFARA